MTEIMGTVVSALDEETNFTLFNRMVVVLSGEWSYALGTIGRWTVWTKDGPAELSWVWLDYRQVSPDSNYFVFLHEQFHNNGFMHAGSMLEKRTVKRSRRTN